MNFEFMEELLKKLKLVIRVHGENHPELAEVGALFDAILQQKDVEENAAKLKEVTDNFTVPADACPTYARVYELLDLYLKGLN